MNGTNLQDLRTQVAELAQRVEDLERNRIHNLEQRVEELERNDLDQRVEELAARMDAADEDALRETRFAAQPPPTCPECGALFYHTAVCSQGRD